MSTLLIAIDPGQQLQDVVKSGISAGSGMQTSSAIEVQIDQGDVVTADGSTRQLNKEEIILALKTAIEYLVNADYPYAAS